MRKLGVTQWLVKIIYLIHRNTWSFVRVNGTFSNGLALGAKGDYILHVYIALCYIEVRLGQLKKKM